MSTSSDPGRGRPEASPAGVSDRPTAVLLDADGVLQATPPGWYDTLVRLGGEGFPEACFEVELRSLRGDGDFREHLGTYLAERGLALDIDEVLAPWLDITQDAAAMAVVAQLRAGGTPAYLATNQQAIRAAHMRAHLRYEDVLDGCFYSYELGVAKPDPDYWRRIAGRLGLAPERLLFVDDRADNVAAARSVGLHAEEVPTMDDGATLRAIFERYDLL